MFRLVDVLLLAAGVASARPAWKQNFLWPLDVSKYQGHVSVDVPPGAKLFDFLGLQYYDASGKAFVTFKRIQEDYRTGLKMKFEIPIALAELVLQGAAQQHHRPRGEMHAFRCDENRRPAITVA